MRQFGAKMRSMPEQGPVLLVDDEATIRQAVTQWLGLAGFETLVHEKASTALNVLTVDFPGVLVTDLKMHGLSGMDLLRHAQQMDPELPVIMITGHGDVETAVVAMRLGAYDFIEKPFPPDGFSRLSGAPSKSAASLLKTVICVWSLPSRRSPLASSARPRPRRLCARRSLNL